MEWDFKQRDAAWFFVIIITLNLATGCAIKGKSDVPTVAAAPDYEQLFPRYVEVCAVSQIRSNFAPPGGTPGHAVMYLKGVCADQEAAYPRLKLCDPAMENLSSGETGIGVSVNKVLRNINWLAVPGARLFFRGNLEADEVLDEEQAVAAILAARDQGVFRGVEIHGEYLPPEDDEMLRLYLAKAETLGTDFALNFGRTSYCIRLPVTETVLARIVGYLNGLNDEYARGEANYNWSGYSDNCSHTLHNALAAAGVWSSMSVNTTKFRQLFNLSIPANEFANLTLLATTENFDAPLILYQNRVLRKTLLDYNWLPMSPGAVMTLLPVHQPNELYETDSVIFVLEMPLLRSKSRRISGMYYEPRYTDLEANLLWFKERYQTILEKRPSDWDTEGKEGSYHYFRRRYYQYIEKELGKVHRMLAELMQ